MIMGILNTGTKTVTFSTLATDPVETSASRIVGTVKAQTIYTGTGSFSFLNCFIAAGTDDLGYLTVTRKTGPLGVITFNGNNSIQCNWDITPDYEPSNGRTVQYSWLSDYDNGKTFTTINKAVNYCSTDNGTSWSVHGDPVDVSASNPRVMSFITTHFSYWVSSDQNSPLPVTLSSFTSNINGRNAKLDWSTSSEISNSGFEIFRSNLSDSLNWIKIGFIKGNGTVNNSSNYSFDDRNLNTGKYKYKLKQIDYNGNIQYFNLSASVEIGVPSKFNLSQNYPNPFNPTTKIDFDLPMDSKVSIKIYDVLGKEIKTIVNDFRTAGYYTVTFDASSFSSGVYFYRIITDGNSKFIMTKKLVILK